MKNVKIVSLVNGLELVGTTELISDGKEYIIKKPAVLVPANGNQLAIMDFMPYAKLGEGLVISTSKVMYVVEPMDSIATEYSRLTSNLVIAKNEPKLPSLLTG